MWFRAPALLFALLYLCAGLSSLSAADFVVEISTRGFSESPQQMDLWAELSATDGKKLPVALDDGRGQVRLTSEVGPWTLSCPSPTLWCEELVIDGEISEESTPRLQVFPAAHLEAALNARGPIPEQIRLQGWASDDRFADVAFSFTTQCAPDAFRAKIPAIPLDLRLAFEGWAPVYLWDVRPPAGKATKIDPITLHTGASLCAFVIDGSTGLPASGAEVSLQMPEPDPGIPATELRRIGRMHWQAETNERGFFQLTGVPEGDFRLLVREMNAPGPSERPFILEPVSLVAEAETCLEDITIPDLEQVAIRVMPPTGPDGDPWTVRLTESHSATAEPLRVEIDGSGLGSVALTPGQYRLTLLDPRGFQALRKSVSVDGLAEVFVEADLVRLQGTVSLSEEPLVAKIRLVSETGDHTFEADFEGRFEGWVSRPTDRMTVHVESVYPAFSRWLELEDFEVEDGVLTVTLDFADQSVEGTVRDQDGRPLRRATVTAMASSGLSVKARSDVEGRFRLNGLEEATYQVWATLRDFGSSETRSVVVRKDLESEQIELTVKAGRPQAGKLLSADGTPVMGARLSVRIPGKLGWQESVSSGADGSFRFRTPNETARAVITVSARAVGLLWSSCVDIRSGEEATLSMPPAPGGTISLPAPAGFGPQSSQLALLTGDGGVLPFSALGRWALQHQASRTETARRFEVPRLATGHYAMTQLLPGLPSGCGVGPVATSGWQQLAPGGLLSFDEP